MDYSCDVLTGRRSYADNNATRCNEDAHDERATRHLLGEYTVEEGIKME